MGGGTPTILTTEQFSQICASLEKAFSLSTDCEFTVEANPATFDKEKVTLLRGMGINRFSIGMQSANPEELRLLGRTHRAEEVIMAVDAVNHGGIDNYNLDLMYGIPNQTLESFGHTLELTKSLSPSHISVYGLQLEEGTPLYRRHEKYVFPDEDTERDMNRLAASVLGSAGYDRYEISNYARNGRECRHNLRYWLREDYIGIGAAAHSFFEGKRYCAPENTDEYISAVNAENYRAIRLNEQFIESDEAVSEYIMLRLRLSKGISPNEFRHHTGMDFSPYEKLMAPFIKSGHIAHTDGRYFFTADGFDVSNYILARLV